MFNIVLDEQRENDVVSKINEVNFYVDKDLVSDYEGFVILSTEENDGRGLSLKPLVQSEGGCSTCSSCH
ncbi:HesB family protein [Clostridium fallax]|uniref:HesB-like selenoprotein n=3 Tax=Clostridium fallax TaxID=1533 RepID=A0A1M4SVK1_9CLOT|nr:HesB-like selenoprotein [Clostridium fallax]SQB07994.1 HesB family protein [Clostridium fallax]